jgi:hypothetical protein
MTKRQLTLERDSLFSKLPSIGKLSWAKRRKSGRMIGLIFGLKMISFLATPEKNDEST